MQRIKPDPKPTDDELRAVYFVERQTRPHWPAEYSRGMADPLTARIVGLIAQHQRRGPTRGQDAPQRPAKPRQPWLQDVASTTAPAPQAPTRRALDFKSRAAGERDDD